MESIFIRRSVAAESSKSACRPQYARDPVRPSLVLWACAAGNGDLADALPVAAAFDLFDRFMLLHDELADESARDGRALGPRTESQRRRRALRGGVSHASRATSRMPQRRLQAARLVGASGARGDRDGADDGATASAVLTAAALQAGA